MSGVPEGRPLRGRPGTKTLPLAGNGRAVGGPIALGLLASYVAVALAGWLAAALVLLVSAPDLAARAALAPHALLATHLVALGFLPFAVTGAAFHLLPVMLRNDVRHPRLLRWALPLLGGGFLVAPGIAYRREALLWAGAALLAAGLSLVLVELLGLVFGAPGNRTLVTSRIGVGLVSLHVAGALVLGAIVFDHGYAPFAGVGHDRWLLVHLHLAVVGWLALLIVTVGRTLGPMLALAPTAPVRRLPVAEAVLTAGLWTLLAGLAASYRPAEVAGGGVVVLTLAAFARMMVRVARTRRIELEAPLAHLLAGVVFLLQAATLGFLMLTDAVSPSTALASYVVFLLLGWAAGVTLGHIGKLLALSLWVWWPPGPRPKQAALYPRALWLVEAAAFAVGVELVGLAPLTRTVGLAYAGGALLVTAALLACAGAFVDLAQPPVGSDCTPGGRALRGRSHAGPPPQPNGCQCSGCSAWWRARQRRTPAAAAPTTPTASNVRRARWFFSGCRRNLIRVMALPPSASLRWPEAIRECQTPAMAARVAWISVAPVKGLALSRREEVLLEPFGVRDDRCFYLIGEDDRLYNGKQIGELHRISADWAESAGELTLRFPDGDVTGTVDVGDPVTTNFYGRDVGGQVVIGPWSDALSEFVGRPLRLVKADVPGEGIDRGGSVSLLSAAAVELLAEVVGAPWPVDPRRFRMLFGIDGVAAHEEDSWVGRKVVIGEATALVRGNVGRCLVTSRDPDTGVRTLPTLDALAEYRGDVETTEKLPFGVWGTVVEPGRVRLGDAIAP